MSRQKSYFDSRLKKNTPFFNRTRSSNDAVVSSRAGQPTGPRPDSPGHTPIEASSESKRKLRIFQFTVQKASRVDSAISATESDLASDDRKTPTDGFGPPPRQFDFADQAGDDGVTGFSMTETATQNDEPLSWGAAAGTLTQHFFRSGDGRTRKRARSSSPICSRDDGPSTGVTADPTTPFAVRHRPLSGKTPVGDHVSVLWDHYATSTASGSKMDGAHRSAALQNLLDNCSSPLSPANSSRVSGLRKWASYADPPAMAGSYGQRPGMRSPLRRVSDRVVDFTDMGFDENDDGTGGQRTTESQDAGLPHRPNVQTESVAESVVESIAGSESLFFPAAAASKASQLQFDDSEFFSDDPDDIADLVSLAATSTAPPISIMPDRPAAKAPQEADLDDFDDELGDDDGLEDEMFAELTATQAAAAQASAQATGPPISMTLSSENKIVRFKVMSVQEGRWRSCFGQDEVEKICVLSVVGVSGAVQRQVHLRQTWLDTPVAADAIVHVIGDFDSTGACIVDNLSNFVILHPDRLLSATHVADAFSCIRRAVLQSRVKATSAPNDRLLYGNMLHQLLQDAMMANRFDREWLDERVRATMPGFYEQMAEIGLSVEDSLAGLEDRIGQITNWAGRFVGPGFTASSRVAARGQREIQLVVTKLLDIEEHVWSPRYGLKGNVDATVEALTADEDGERRLVMPLELKTGRGESVSHRAQTALYTLLLSDRYDVPVQEGILFYLDKLDMTQVTAVRAEIIHMIIKRNQLAAYMADKTALPPVLNQHRMCERCYSQRSCFSYNKMVEDGDGSDFLDTTRPLFDEQTAALTAAHSSFFRAWEKVLSIEEGDSVMFRELWTMTSTEREKAGRCFAHLVIEPGTTHTQVVGQQSKRYEYTLFRPARFGEPAKGGDTEIAAGELIVISDEQGHYCLAKGFAVKVEGRKMTVVVDRRLHNARTRLAGFNPANRQCFSGISDYSAFPDQQQPSPESGASPEILYRVDRDEYSNGMATLRNNLIQIMDDSIFQARNLRELIIELRKPRFSSTTVSPAALIGEEASMNRDQTEAVQKVMTAQDYALILGMPGTGKTTTIATIIKALVKQNKTVLLASYTHTAVDNILLKVAGAGFDVLRLGTRAKVDPAVQQLAVMADGEFDSPEHVRECWMKPPVVAATSFGISHPLFSLRQFDYCIVDEASQITLPGCLGPIRMASTFVLVGDHFQLPPLVRSPVAIEGGLDVSLFKLLCEAHPDAVVNLEHQYRMNSDIMAISNELIYSGRLRCGTEAVANRTCEIRYPDAVTRYHHPASVPRGIKPCSGRFESCHLARAIDPASSVLFFNTDTVGAVAVEKSGGGDRRQNEFEADVVCQLLSLFIDGGCPADEIGVVTFYRGQLGLLKSVVRSRRTIDDSRQTQPLGNSSPTAGMAQTVEMHTADKFQGRDKEIVIVSFVRNNDNGVVGNLLLDHRRINVAVTRAKSKLILVGSRNTLLAAKRKRDDSIGDSVRPGLTNKPADGGSVLGVDVLRGMVQLCDERKWVVDLPPTAVTGHVFGETKLSQAAAGSTEVDLTATGRKLSKLDIEEPILKPRTVAKVDLDVLLKKRPLSKEVYSHMTG